MQWKSPMLKISQGATMHVPTPQCAYVPFIWCLMNPRCGRSPGWRSQSSISVDRENCTAARCLGRTSKGGDSWSRRTHPLRTACEGGASTLAVRRARPLRKQSRSASIGVIRHAAFGFEKPHSTPCNWWCLVLGGTLWWSHLRERALRVHSICVFYVYFVRTFMYVWCLFSGQSLRFLSCVYMCLW